MSLAPIELGLTSNPAEHGHQGACRLVNCYAEMVGKEGKSPTWLKAVDGLTDFATLTDGGAVRAMFALTDSDLYVVAGRLLFRVDATGTASQIGGIPSDGMVTIARNRLSPEPQIAIVCDGLYFILRSNLLTQFSDPDLPAPISVASLNGYFSFLLADGRHFASELDDEDVTALSFAAAGSNPDPGVRNWTRGPDLFFGGTRSIEAWQDVGGDPYPFSRVTAIDIGVLAGASVSEIDQTSAFVAHDGTVRILDGYQAQIISNPAVQRFIENETTPSALSACSWQRLGHTFYALSGANGTWVYDATTQLWHQRESATLTRWRGSRTAMQGREIIVGDYATGLLYKMEADQYEESGDPLIMTIDSMPVTAFPGQLHQDALYVDALPGVGLASATDSLANPVMMMSYADDGANFGVERRGALGAAGQRNRRLKWTRMGLIKAGRSRTYRLRISAAVARQVSSTAYVEAARVAP